MEKKNVWIHGDVALGNILVKNGKLCGIIYFGMLGTGDPACDYSIAFTFFEKENREFLLKNWIAIKIPVIEQKGVHFGSY